MSNNGINTDREDIRYSAVNHSGRLDCSAFAQKVTPDIKHMLNSHICSHLYDMNGYCLRGDRSGQIGYTFDDCRDASRLLRLYRRFHSVENDRKEEAIDLLNSITESHSNSNQLLTDISVKIEKSGGTQSQLLQKIADAFTNNNTISQSIDSNVKAISDSLKSIEPLVLELKPLTKELSNSSSKSESIINLMIEYKSLFEKTLIQLNDNQLASVLQNQNNSLLIESKLNDLKLEFNETKQELRESRRELEESKQELKEIKEEMHLICEAITDVLPNKLMDAFKIMNQRTNGCLLF